MPRAKKTPERVVYKPVSNPDTQDLRTVLDAIFEEAYKAMVVESGKS